MRRTILLANQVMKRATNRPPIRYSAIGTPRTRIHSPMGSLQKLCQRSAKLTASRVLFVISSVAPPDSRFEEAVDVSVQYCGRIADLVVGTQGLDHLVRLQHVVPHLISPRAAAVALQRVHLSTLF